MAPTRLLIVDSHRIIADSLSLSLTHNDSFVAMSCSSYSEIVGCIDTFQPQIIVINVRQESIEQGFAACRDIIALSGTYAIVLIAPRILVDGETFSLDAVEAGADGVLISEDLDLNKLTQALWDVEAGHSLLDPKQLREALLLRRNAPPVEASASPLEVLTPREQEIIDLIARGVSTSAIAEQLVISERTVQNHINNLLTKLKVRTRSEAIARLYMWRHAASFPQATEQDT